MNETKNLWYLMKSDKNKEEFTRTLVDYVIRNVKDAFGYCCRNEISINEYCPPERFCGNKNQITTFTSVRLSEMWENGCYEQLKDLIERYEMENKIVNAIKRWTTSEADIIVFNEPWEIKTSQAKNSFTGATHSQNKCKNYILINYEIDKNVKLHNVCEPNLIPELCILLLKIPVDYNYRIWKGEPTKHSSFTTLKIPNEFADMNSILNIWGSVKKSKKFCKILRKKNPLLK